MSSVYRSHEYLHGVVCDIRVETDAHIHSINLDFIQLFEVPKAIKLQQPEFASAYTRLLKMQVQQSGCQNCLHCYPGAVSSQTSVGMTTGGAIISMDIE